MSDEIDDFLKQAAKRRQERQQQQRPSDGGRPKLPKISPPPPPPNQSSQGQHSPIHRAPMPSFSNSSNDNDSIPVAQVVEHQRSIATRVTELRSSIPTSGLTGDQPVTGMASTIADAFSPDLPTEQNERRTRKVGEKRASVTDNAATIAPAAQSGSVSSSMLIYQLRHPETLRMAIIAHEILKRPWT